MTEKFEKIPEPPWMKEMIDKRFKFLLESGVIEGARQTSIKLVMTPLRESPPFVDSDRWERSCDHCGWYCPPGEEYFSGIAVRLDGDVRVYMSYGLCPRCKQEIDKTGEASG